MTEITPRKGLFLPGYACTSQIWQLIREEINADFEITCLDWPTHLTPGFNSIEDFSNWLLDTLQAERVDFIVGHSLGGLVALDLLEKAENIDPNIVVIESFLTPPMPFFQNLLLSTADPVQARWINTMLGQEKIRYSPYLAANLRDIDITERLIARKRKFFALYGDRGSGNPQKVLDELRWSQELSDRVEVKVIPNACHFPMIENPLATLKALRGILHL